MIQYTVEDVENNRLARRYIRPELKTSLLAKYLALAGFKEM